MAVLASRSSRRARSRYFDQNHRNDANSRLQFKMVLIHRPAYFVSVDSAMRGIVETLSPTHLSLLKGAEPTTVRDQSGSSLELRVLINLIDSN
jgi:hypothetical protein